MLRTYLTYQGITSAAGFAAPLLNLGRSEATAVSVTQLEGTGNSSYQSLQAELRINHRHKLHLRSAFTWSHAIDDVSDLFDLAGAFALPQNSRARSERGSANFDARLRLATHFVWDLPFQRKKGLVSGWQMSGIGALQTAQPFTVNSIVDSNLDGNLTDRLDSTVGLFNSSAKGRIRLALDTAVRALDLLAPLGESGRIGRNTFRAFGLANLDVAVSKQFKLEGLALTFRLEAYNVFNRASFGIPVRILEFPGFGSATRTITPPRTLQVHLRIAF